MLSCLLTGHTGEWGFFGHKLANRIAVFTLPSDLIGFYKANIDYVEAHAVDADKRRYASPHEAVRHYIDLDREADVTSGALPRSWDDAIAAYLNMSCISEDTSTIPLDTISYENRLEFVQKKILPVFFEDEWRFSVDTIQDLLDITLEGCKFVLAEEGLTEHGILPWNLVSMQRRLEKAFSEGDEGMILRLSADIGHYIGDAHVPLHTSVNYNGQLTGQEGIHAFWESRVPELFAEGYDLFTGRANYIEDPETFYWEIVLQSHALVDSVLEIDRQLTAELGEDAKYCYDQRGSAIVRTQCEEFAHAFDVALGGMVERRLRATILAIGSAWYTAWVDADRPKLPRSGYIAAESERLKLDTLEREFANGALIGRPHE